VIQPEVVDESQTPAVDVAPVTETRYDAVGNVKWTQDPAGLVTTQEYDAANRPLSTTQSGMTLNGSGQQVNLVTTTRSHYEKTETSSCSWMPRTTAPSTSMIV